jgi:hypothetical protein
VTWTLARASIVTTGDRYEVRGYGMDAEYFVVSINGARPSTFHRLETAALDWVASRELAAARRRARDAEHGPAAAPVCDACFIFANEHGETSSRICRQRRCAR